MQNNKSFSKKIRDKGYYIVLALCVAAVGVSGYLFCRSLATKHDSPSGLDDLALNATIPSATAKDAKDKDVRQSDTKTITPVIGTIEDDPGSKAPVKNAAVLQTVKPLDGSISQAYSMDRLSYNVTTKDWRTHDGLDLSAAMGTTVCAAADGVVESVFTDDFFGKTVTISHENGYVTHYANLAETVSVEVGDTVKAGAAIGTVGATALLEVGAEPHLHFSVTKNNVSIDPESFLP